ncbi:MAG: phage terminase large subunit [Clostridia bacterium]|nr:phage terminase large subunit [Clostridia bacterium]
MNSTEKLLSSLHPFPPQEAFFRATAPRVAYGGARGGGKSFAMRAKLVLLALAHPGIQILLLRRTFPELRENHINPLRRILKGVAEWRESTKEFTFPGGSRIKLGYLNEEADALQYQGQSYEVIGMEEATQFTESQYYAMTESNRLHGLLREPFTPRMYFTCNPGGVGHAWVKRLFLDRDYREGENGEDYVFIPSTVYDNDYLMKEDPAYVKTLESLPPLRRRAMLYGDWDAFEGQFFPEFDRARHRIEPFAIPKNWIRFAALDYGLDMTACLWMAYPPDRSRLVVYRELYEPDLVLSSAAARILEVGAGETTRYVAASPDLAGRRQEGGRSGFDILTSHGVKGLCPAENARIPGWRRLREFLRADCREGGAYLGIFPQCTNLLRTLPKLIFDQRVAEDAALTPHEYTHAPDALRYGISSLPFLPGEELTPAERTRDLRREFFGRDPEDRSYMGFLKK